MVEFYGKREAKLIAGVGIFLMLIHHFFGFPTWRLSENGYIEPIVIGGISIERVFAAFGKICVSIFAFATGFAIYKFPIQYNTPAKCLTRLFKFLVAYWVILALFLFYGWCIGDPLPPLSYFLKHNLIGNYTGPEAPYVNVPFAWYVMYYIFLMAIAPILIWLFKKSNAVFDVLFAILITICVQQITLNTFNVIIGVLPLSIIGILCCKWHVFDILHQKWNPSIILSIGIITIIVASRQVLTYINWGGVFWRYYHNILPVSHHQYIQSIIRCQCAYPIFLDIGKKQHESMVLAWNIFYRFKTLTIPTILPTILIADSHLGYNSIVGSQQNCQSHTTSLT